MKQRTDKVTVNLFPEKSDFDLTGALSAFPLAPPPVYRIESTGETLEVVESRARLDHLFAMPTINDAINKTAAEIAKCGLPVLEVLVFNGQTLIAKARAPGRTISVEGPVREPLTVLRELIQKARAR